MVERNNTGHATLAILKQLYPTELIYKEEQTFKEENKETERLGWHTNMMTKPKMFFDLSTAVNEGYIHVISNELLHEMRMYDRNGLLTTKSDPEASNHFDLLISLAIALQGRATVQTTNTKVETFQIQGNNADEPFDPFAGI
jgi:hypothetical protein